MIALLLLTTACVEVESPPQACRDTADAIASKATDCGDDYDSVYDQFVAAAAGGDCSNIVAIRDRDALYDDCIPGIDSLSCTQLDNGELPDACRNQLSQ